MDYLINLAIGGVAFIVMRVISLKSIAQAEAVLKENTRLEWVSVNQRRKKAQAKKDDALAAYRISTYSLYLLLGMAVFYLLVNWAYYWEFTKSLFAGLI